MHNMISYSCATGYFSFGYELAHNVGYKYDRGTENECNKNKMVIVIIIQLSIT